MKVLDFQRSFVVFEIDFDRKPTQTVSDTRQNRHNRARIQIDCRCQVTDPTGKSTDYFLGESCKTELVAVAREVGIFVKPNADFRPVMSDEHTLFFKSWERNRNGSTATGSHSERQVVRTREAFTHHALQLAYREGTRLTSATDIVKATDEGRPLIARTEFSLAAYCIRLDYPVLTFDVSEKLLAFQTDTGPVIFPELSEPHTHALDTFRLAFCAFNAPDWIEFIVQKPTPVGSGISVNHYSESVQITGCQNSILRVD